MEHITTEDAVAFVTSNTDGTFSTLWEENHSPLFQILEREQPAFIGYSFIVHMSREVFLS